MAKVLNIYGVMVDDDGFGETIKYFRNNKPNYIQSEALEKWVRVLLENQDEEGFYLYKHNTSEDKLNSIIYGGLRIYEDGGGLESTMSRCFDSKSEDIEGDINYFLNSINTPNEYGKSSIVAIMPRNYESMYRLTHKTDKPTVPSYCIAFGKGPHSFVYGQAYKDGLEDSNKKNR